MSALPDGAFRMLCDPRAVRSLLAPLLTAAGEPRQLRVERCWPARDQGARFEWSFTLGGERQSLYGAAPVVEPRQFRGVYAAGTTVEGRAAGGARRAGDGRERRLSVRAYLPEHRLLVHSADLDPEMPQVRTLLDADALCGLVAGRVERGVAGATSCLVGYKPGRRAAVVVRRGGPKGEPLFVGKSFRNGRAATLVATHERLAGELRRISGGRVAVPGALRHVPELNLAILEWAAGASCAAGARLDAHRFHKALHAVRELHRVPPDGLQPFTPTDELAVAERWLALLERLDDRRAARGRRLLAPLIEWAKRLPQFGPRTIHRDFYEKQLVWREQATIILDLDTLAAGDPCQDLGNLVAHAALHDLQHGRGADDLATRLRAAARVYARGGGRADPGGVAFYCASSLIRGGALHAFRTLTRPHAGKLWRLAREVIREFAPPRATRGRVTAGVGRRPAPIGEPS